MTSYRSLGESAWAWVLGQVRHSDGPWIPVAAGDAEAGNGRDTLYDGIAGLAPVLAEIRQYRALSAQESALADGIVARLAREAAGRTDVSLFDGLAGDVTALRLLAPGREPADRLADVQPPEYHDVISGSAGVLLTLTWLSLDGTRFAEDLLRAAEPAAGGLDWRMKPGYPSSNPNFSHGTAGVAAALALAGPAYLDAARQGAAHLLAIADLTDGGFVVEHTIPRSKREVEPVTYNWCHGPAGTSHVFAALAHAGVEEVAGHPVADLRRRCLHSLLTCGIPQRLRPGFWDNDGRCCGTAGVGDILLDAAQSLADERLLAGARTMADALVSRAVDGRFWRFIEYRIEEPLLPPGTGWMQGAAGIAAFLLRLERVLETGWSAPIVDRPDNWFAVPGHLRVSRRPFTGERPAAS